MRDNKQPFSLCLFLPLIINNNIVLLFDTLVVTFACLVHGVAVVTRFAVLAAWSHRVVEAALTFSSQAVACIAVPRVDVVVAGTLLTTVTWQTQIAIETGAASVTAWA